MQKLICLFLIFVTCVSFVACEISSKSTVSTQKTTEKSEPTPYRNNNIVSYMKANEEKVYYAICSDYDMPYYGSYEINGDDLIITIRTERWGEYTKDWASILQKVNGADRNFEYSFQEYYENLQKEMPGIRNFEVRVCDLNGNLFFTLPEPL